ncbi:MAG: LacI family DNA-binding transcriptional regulator [Sedimentisphaerales bacterium]|nr:LacI family DNA-binding transcriptional regulator [Sedimentisphaerales bacterium]
MATLQDIARRAGVSIPTVSRILNPYNTERGASKATQERVRKIAEELNYSPNAFARALSTRRTHNIGVMWDKRMDSPEESVFWSGVLQGVMVGCKNLGYECMVSVEDYRIGDTFELPRSFREKYADGVIVTYPLGDTEKVVQQKLLERNIPFVAIWTAPGDERIWSVDIDPQPGFQQAMMHLYELGHRIIGYCVYPNYQTGEYHASRQCEKQTKEEFGIDLIPLEVDLTRYSHMEHGRRLARAIYKGELPITAMIMGDVISIETIRCLTGYGWKIPERFSVVGLSDTFLCQFSCPQLTSIVQPLNRLGREAVALLTDCIKAKSMGVNLTPRHVSLGQSFVVRDSTAPLNGHGKRNGNSRDRK